MDQPRQLLLALSTILFAGTGFAWYTVATDITAFYRVYETLWRFADCTPPNPFTQACFYGAFVFLIALVWSIRIYRDQVVNRHQSLKKLSYLIGFGTLFGWSNFSYMLYSQYTATTNPFTCVVGAGASPFSTPCFIGSVFFTLSLIAAVLAWRSTRPSVQ